MAVAVGGGCRGRVAAIRPRRRPEGPPLTTRLAVGLVALPLLVLVVAARCAAGPVLLALTRSHGVHACDAAALAVALPAWLVLLARARRSPPP